MLSRLATWYQLERAETDSLVGAVARSNEDKIAAIARAQQAGTLSSHFSPLDLLTTVLALAAMWSSVTPEFAALARTQSVEHRRQVVLDAVAAVLTA